MDCNPTLQAFRREATAFLDVTVPRKEPVARGFTWGEGSDRLALLEEPNPETEQQELRAAVAFRAKRFDASFGWITGPVEYGGRGLPVEFHRAYQAIENGYCVPSQIFFEVSTGMVAPTILAHGTDELRRAYLAQLQRGDVIACQLFSEPGAGSDLAGLSTKAVRDGDQWVLNGQKVWTSGAQFSDVGEILCRTAAGGSRHDGITAFLVDMHATGVEVRPLRQMNGGASFNEVFLSDVRVPDDQRIGPVDGGWAVAITTLAAERASLGSGVRSGGRGVAGAGRALELLRHFGSTDDPVLRQELARLYIGFAVAKYTNRRAAAAAAAGRPPGPQASIAKLALTQNLTASGEFAARVLGPRLVADTGEWGTFAWAEFLLTVPGLRVAGGTDEIQRNILAERVLGLPKTPAPG